MEKATPRPVVGALAQSPLYRIAMNVVELLYKLRMIANVEIVVALLPEMVGVSDQTPRHSLLQRFEGVGERALLLETRDIPTQAKTGLEWGTVDCGLAEEKVNVLGHHDVCVDTKAELRRTRSRAFSRTCRLASVVNRGRRYKTRSICWSAATAVSAPNYGRKKKSRGCHRRTIHRKIHRTIQPSSGREKAGRQHQCRPSPGKNQRHDSPKPSRTHQSL